MSKQAPSIFNDVLGPVMRGPSSSHVAGAMRIASLLRMAMKEDIKKIYCDFDINGSLAESHDGHGSDMGFACGILGLPLTDPKVDKYNQLVKEAGIDLEYRILDYGAEHPNHYRIFSWDSQGKEYSMDAISTGGGMIEVIQLNHLPVSIMGDFYEYCIEVALEAGNNFDSEMSMAPDNFFDSKMTLPARLEEIKNKVEGLEKFSLSSSNSDLIFSLNDLSSHVFGESNEKEAPKIMLEIKCAAPQSESWLKSVQDCLNPINIFAFTPVLPTQSTYQQDVPFKTAAELLNYNQGKDLELWELALLYESIRGNTTKDVIWQETKELFHIMENAVQTGLAGTTYECRVLHAQSHKMKEAKRLVPGDVMNTVITYITAVMESKSAMEVIVAAPTCGSCGCLPGTLIGAKDAMNLSEETAIKGLLAAGMIGVFYAQQATFAAEVGGCQVECGAGSGMAAAAIAQICGGNAEECIDAASMALQALTGLACDPVANRVEVPCLNKNVAAGMNALASANMRLAGFDKVIPLDETIQAMYDIGKSLPLELRCTFGGLGKTKTSMEIRERLDKLQFGK